MISASPLAQSTLVISNSPFASLICSTVFFVALPGVFVFQGILFARGLLSILRGRYRRMGIWILLAFIPVNSFMGSVVFPRLREIIGFYGPAIQLSQGFQDGLYTVLFDSYLGIMVLVALIPSIHVVLNLARRRYSNLFPTRRWAVTGAVLVLYSAYCSITAERHFKAA